MVRYRGVDATAVVVNLDGEGEVWRNGSAGKRHRIVPPIREGACFCRNLKVKMTNYFLLTSSISVAERDVVIESTSTKAILEFSLLVGCD